MIRMNHSQKRDLVWKVVKARYKGRNKHRSSKMFRPTKQNKKKDGDTDHIWKLVSMCIDLPKQKSRNKNNQFD